MITGTDAPLQGTALRCLRWCCMSYPSMLASTALSLPERRLAIDAWPPSNF